MATQVVHLASSISGGASNPDSALGNTPATWAGDLNTNSNWTHEWAFTNPTETEKAVQQQSVAVVFRKGTNSGDPSVTVNVRRDGQTIATASATITSTTGQTVTATWTPPAVSSSQGVSLEVAMSAVGGSGSVRNSAQMSMATWTAQTVVPQVADPDPTPWSVWDGSVEQPLWFDGVWNGTTIIPGELFVHLDATVQPGVYNQSTYGNSVYQ